MQLPDNLLSEMGAPRGKRQGLTWIAVASMVIATVAGFFWGWMNRNQEQTRCNVEATCPVNKEVTIKPMFEEAPNAWAQYRDPCLGCGGG